MKVFALTGPTGLLCETLLYEILKNNLDDLSNIEIMCLGRDTSDHSLLERIKDNLMDQGWQYLMKEKDTSLIEAMVERLTPINIDLSKDGLDMSREHFNYLNSKQIDHFIHPAALTDFRNTAVVAERLKRINIDGGNEILKLIGSLQYTVGTYSYVSSAYASGNTFGKIDPDYIRPDKNFRNNYEDTKLVAEVAARDFCRRNNIRYKIFRPSTIGGRLIENPKGYVNKYDVYLGWNAFFVAMKRQKLGNVDWDTLYNTPVDIPVRITSNPETGLNIVSTDFAAKVMYHALVTDHPAIDYHIVGTRTIPVNVLMGTMLQMVNVEGCSFVREPITEMANAFEQGFYATVGMLYTPYVAQDAHSDFTCDSMIDVCEKAGIPIVGIDNVENLSIMIDYAKKHHFGLS